jgi:hypothetical protein
MPAALGPVLFLGWQALSTAFLLVRLFLYVVLTSIAWVGIVEQGPPYQSSYEKLSASALRKHNHEYGGDDDSDSESGSMNPWDEAESVVERNHPDWAKDSFPDTPEPKQEHRISHLAPALPPAPPHKVEVARLPPDVAKAAAQELEQSSTVISEKHNQSEIGATGGKGKKKKKPLLNRWVDRHIWAAQGQDSGPPAGILMYRGANKIAKTTERVAATTILILDSAIRDVGVEAARVAEFEIMRKYLKFFVVWGVLTAVLVPMPGMMSINLVVGGSPVLAA